MLQETYMHEDDGVTIAVLANEEYAFIVTPGPQDAHDFEVAIAVRADHHPRWETMPLSADDLMQIITTLFRAQAGLLHAQFPPVPA